MIAEGNCREIAENAAGREGAPRVVGIVGVPLSALFVTEPSRCLRCGTRRARQDIGFARIPQQRRVAERQQQPAGVGVISRRGQARCRRQRQEARSSLSV